MIKAWAGKVRIVRGADAEAGYATVATAGILAAISGLLLVVAAASSQVVAQHRAQVAADLSAVAGAWALAYGEDACSAAQHTAGMNDGHLQACTPEGDDVVVSAVVRGRDATARAGRI